MNVPKQKRIKAKARRLGEDSIGSEVAVYAIGFWKSLSLHSTTRAPTTNLLYDQIKNLPILFKIWVMNHALTSGRCQWLAIIP